MHKPLPRLTEQHTTSAAWLICGRTFRMIVDPATRCKQGLIIPVFVTSSCSFPSNLRSYFITFGISKLNNSFITKHLATPHPISLKHDFGRNSRRSCCWCCCGTDHFCRRGQRNRICFGRHYRWNSSCRNHGRLWRKGSACAVLQSIGAVGLSVPGIVIVSGVGAAAGAAIASGGLAPGSPAANILAASRGAAAGAIGTIGFGSGGIVPGSPAANIMATSMKVVEKASDWAASQPIVTGGLGGAGATITSAAGAAVDAVGAFGFGEGGIVAGSQAANIVDASRGAFEQVSGWANQSIMSFPLAAPNE
ncbi:hypothetical protein EDD21DRAFT_438489 [Dissophora ornata]|nr:hypothetical protein EDD21DRAFT_438489 [Dissophora ornata]